jgi:hypothetical protein
MTPLNRYERIRYQELADEIERQPWKNSMMRWNLRHLKAALNYKPSKRRKLPRPPQESGRQ